MNMLLKKYVYRYFVQRVYFSSVVYKSNKRIITQDEQIYSGHLPSKTNNTTREFQRDKIIRSNKSNMTFFEHYENKSVEGLEITDERFGPAILNSRNFNSSNSYFVLEGINAINDALNLGAVLKTLYFTKREILDKIPYKGLCKEADVYYVTYRDIKKISNLSTHPGIIGIFERIPPEQLQKDPVITKILPVTLIVDNIRDPGNLGTLIRTGSAFHINKIIMTNNCVSLYNEKVIRSSMSSFLALPVYEVDSWDEVKNALDPNTIVHTADVRRYYDPFTVDQDPDEFADNTLVPYYQDGVVDFSESSDKSYGLVVGGEIDGISKDASRLSLETHGLTLTIPTIRRIQSLNVAISSAIILGEFQRRFLSSRTQILNTNK